MIILVTVREYTRLGNRDECLGYLPLRDVSWQDLYNILTELTKLLVINLVSSLNDFETVENNNLDCKSFNLKIDDRNDGPDW